MECEKAEPQPSVRYTPTQQRLLAGQRERNSSATDKLNLRPLGQNGAKEGLDRHCTKALIFYWIFESSGAGCVPLATVRSCWWQ